MVRDRDATEPMPIPSWMIIDAVRYAIGRQTYQVGITCDWLVAHWHRLPSHAQEIIRQDLEAEFARDDRCRANPCGVFPLGMDLDRAQWERVRRLWTQTPGG